MIENKKIKILFGLEAADAGALKHLTYLVTNIDSACFDITVILSPNNSGRMQKAIIKMRQVNAKVILIPMSKKLRVFKDAYTIYKLVVYLSKHDYDVVHAHSSKAGAIFRIAAWLCKVKIILYTPHCFYFQGKKGFLNRYYRYIEKLLGKISTCVIVSSNEKHWVLKYGIVPACKIKNINNAIDLLEYIPLCAHDASLNKSCFSLGGTVITGIGRLTNQKDWFTYIYAANEILKTRQDVSFLIVGDGEMGNALIRLVQHLGIGHKVLFTGYIENIAEVFSFTDIFVSTSLWEGLPYVLLEAMWYQKPIIASNLEYKGILQDRQNALLFKVMDYLDLASKIEHLINDHFLMNEIALTGHKSIALQFDFETFVGRHERLYKNLFAK